MRYCLRCKEGVGDEEHYKHIQGGEYVLVGVCPVCGSELVTEAEPCPICGEPMPKGRPACFHCTAQIMVGLDHLMDRMRGKTQSRLEIWERVLELADDVTELYEKEEKQDDNRI